MTAALAQAAAVPALGMTASLVDEAVARFGGAEHEAEILDARGDYDERRGRVFEDEGLWETWTQAFLEWYVLERTPHGAHQPLAARLLPGEIDPARRHALQALLTSHRSLFEVMAVAPGRVELHDLCGGARFAVDEQRALHGVAQSDVVEARLVGLAGRVQFGRTFLYHPTGTRDAIVRYLDHCRTRRGMSRRDAIDAVAALRVRCERYAHMSPEKVYEGAAG